ncbi:MAG: ABC transporter ATP-binding protein [Chitinophagaceae bacterium]|nr:ABC transporter ATP-binding protein [Chitinophagaceae bacterium]
MKPVIEIHQLGKKYRIGKAEPYLALRDVLSTMARNIFRKENKDKQDFWALQDINLSIEKGERIGIIGRNGAGKSTLLKILSRVTWPTTGSAIIRGRLASLLEVGTGFHPELTGRENIYLNGSILGLKKAEINKQFDAIVDFSGVETFLDTPLKNYSSGMQLRLAFAVAAHLEPEVLLIDEVLAVGDLEFQKKCIGKMEEISKEHGRTLLFVSHNLKAINDICSRAVLLNMGKIKVDGPANEVIAEYISMANDHHTIENNISVRTEPIHVSEIRPINSIMEHKTTFTLGESIGISIVVSNKSWPQRFNLGIALNTIAKGRILVNTVQMPAVKPGTLKKIVAWLPSEELTPNSYTIDISVSDEYNNLIELSTDTAGFEISAVNTKFESLAYDYGVINKGLIWETVD